MSLLKVTQDLIWKLTYFIGKTLKKEKSELEIIHYGIQVIIMNLLKVLLLFITAYFLGKLKYTILAFIVFGILRTFASGAHAKSTLLCIIGNYILFLGNVYLSFFLELDIKVIIILYIISLILILLYSPAGTKKRPINDKSLRKSLKIKSIVTILICFILSILIKNPIYCNIITLAILEESLCTTPILFKLLNN